MIPANTAKILEFLGFKLDQDFEVGWTGTETIICKWYSVITQPTDQEINDASNDLTTINGQVFSAWYAEHGGNAVSTLRREAKEALDNQTADTNALIRALAFVVMDEINILRAQHSMADRTAAQLRTTIKNKIDSGDADT